ncbi:MAG: D-alanine--D-alanine ligase [Myxococcota bacterium]
MLHEDLVPPDSLEGMDDEAVDRIKTEYDVCAALTRLGHEVHKLGLHDELRPLRQGLREVEPHVVFNLLEEFHGEAMYDHHVVSYLELARAAYTGCNPRGLVLGRDKALSKKILAYHRIRVPHFAVARRGRKLRRPQRLAFPLIVKSLSEEGSLGISEASVVHNDDKLAERIAFIHDSIGTDAIVEQFIDGRELYSAVLGNHLLTVYPTWELDFDNIRSDAPRIATRRVKFDTALQKRRRVEWRQAELDDEMHRKITKLSKRIYRALGLSGYARIDYRLSPKGELYFLEANPNPDIADYEEFAGAAAAAGLDYGPLLQKIVNLGVSWRHPGSS